MSSIEKVENAMKIIPKDKLRNFFRYFDAEAKHYKEWEHRQKFLVKEVQESTYGTKSFYDLPSSLNKWKRTKLLNLIQDVTDKLLVTVDPSQISNIEAEEYVLKKLNMLVV